MVISQGDVFWVDMGARFRSGPAFMHPLVVIQNDLFNRSGIRTTVLCSLTSNLTYATRPGNVLLDAGEANLPKPSVVNVTRIVTVDKQYLTERIGSISRERLAQVLAGIELVILPRDVGE